MERGTQPAQQADERGIQNEVELLRRKERRRKNKYLLISVLTMVVFLLIWELCSDVLRLLPVYSLPSPIAAVEAFIVKFYERAPDRGYIWQHALASLQVVLIVGGPGIVVGITLGNSQG